LNITLSYIDHNFADLKEREKFSLIQTRISSIYKKILEKDGVLGVVIISTCNRTEIYLSLEEDVTYEPFLLLCEAADIDEINLENTYKTLCNNDVIVHLCNLCCGVLSPIFGECQIISQVKSSILFARENNVTDSIIEVVFRTAISCGKKVRTLVEFSNENHSAANETVKILKGDKSIKDILVIGNGSMGKLVAESLINSGYNVFITLRKYKYHNVVIPYKTVAVEYDMRYSVMNGVDAIVSATVSPHYTVRYDDFLALKNKPRMLVDLAVPRDIDSEINNIDNVRCFNIDDIAYDVNDEYKNRILEKIRIITTKYINDFYKWYEYKTKLIREI